MHFVYKTDNLFPSIRVSDENSSVTKGFHFLNLFELQTFYVFKMHYSKPHHQFQPFLASFVIFMDLLIFLSYMTLKMKSTTNELRKGWKLAWYHHLTHIACATKLRWLRQKLDALRVQNGQSLSKYQDFSRKLICYKGISFFLTYLNSIVFPCSKCTIQSHIINLQPFATSYVIFHAFTDYFML